MTTGLCESLFEKPFCTGTCSFCFSSSVGPAPNQPKRFYLDRFSFLPLAKIANPSLSLPLPQSIFAHPFPAIQNNKDDPIGRQRNAPRTTPLRRPLPRMRHASLQSRQGASLKDEEHLQEGSRGRCRCQDGPAYAARCGGTGTVYEVSYFWRGG